MTSPADRKSWAVLRRKVFREPPTERNRVWQTDFSEFETACGGIWRISAVIDYVTKYCLSITVTPTGRGADAVRCVELAIDEAQRVLGLADLRVDRGLMDVLDAEDNVIGQAPAPIAVVSDNGPCYRGKTFQALFTDHDDPLLRHVRTRPAESHGSGQLPVAPRRLHRDSRRLREGAGELTRLADLPLVVAELQIKASG